MSEARDPSRAHHRASPVGVATVGMILLSTVAGAVAGPVGLAKYRGIHPVWPQTGGFCYIDVDHVHNRAPTDLRVYRVLAGGENLFVGDPVALGYDGPKFGYFGPHPLDTGGLPASDKIYCYLRGPHFHAHQPEAGGAFVLKQGVYWFTGSFPPQFDRDRFNIWVNDSPALTSYLPPKVTISDAPSGYRLPETVEPPHVLAPPVPTTGAKKTRTGTPKTGLRQPTPR